MKFRELSDDEWELIMPLLLPRAKVGRPRTNDRRVMSGILYVLTTGCRWMDISMDITAFRRLKRWQNEGVWSKILGSLINYSKLSLEKVSVDSTTVEARKGGSS